MIINSIGLIVLFLRNKNYLKIAKILLMLILTISFFFDKEPSIRIFYFLASLGLISFIILDKKLNPIITLFTYYIFITIVVGWIAIPLACAFMNYLYYCIYKNYNFLRKKFSRFSKLSYLTNRK